MYIEGTHGTAILTLVLFLLPSRLSTAADADLSAENERHNPPPSGWRSFSFAVLLWEGGGGCCGMKGTTMPAAASMFMLFLCSFPFPLLSKQFRHCHTPQYISQWVVAPCPPAVIHPLFSLFHFFLLLWHGYARDLTPLTISWGRNRFSCDGISYKLQKPMNK